MKTQMIKPVFLILGGLTLAVLFAASQATTQPPEAPAVSGTPGKAEDGGQTAGQGSRGGNTKGQVQEAPRPGIPAGEKELQRLKRTPGGKSDGSTAVPPER